MKPTSKLIRVHNRTSKEVRPTSNRNGFMNFVDDYVKYCDIPRDI